MRLILEESAQYAEARIIFCMNLIGVVCALSAFLNIWFGHVAVRFLEARAVSIKLPAAIFALIGLVLEIGALFSRSQLLAAALGISGVIMLWDAFEFVRQQRRVIKGHAPANPKNPRHRRILAEHASASTIEWLKREPLGRSLSNEELSALRENAG
jgi:hypothetical protein